MGESRPMETKMHACLIRAIVIRLYDSMVLKKINTVFEVLLSLSTYSTEACETFLPYIKKDILILK